MKYTVNCQEGCGRHLGWLDLPNDVALGDRDKGFLCEDCAAKAAERRPAAEAAPLLSKEQQERLSALKAKIGPSGAVSASDLDELVSIVSGR